MTLSQAIRLGSMLKPHGRGFYQTLGGSCALGAGLDAIGIAAEIQNTLPDKTLNALFPVCARAARCPVPYCDDSAKNVGDVIPHLNDDHDWTREQIAAWVETIEAKQAATNEPAALSAEAV
jgi:hypothetical protein